jgi:alpha-glucosidase
MVKDDQLLNDPENPDWDGIIPFHRLKHIYSNNHPEVHAIIRKMRQVLDSYADRVMVGEIWSLPNEEMIKYYGENEDECHLPFNFGFINIEWQANTLRRRIENYERVLPPTAWPNWVLGNHDEHRVATRVGPQQARVANMLLLTLRGTPTAYYGDELGMVDGFIPLNRIQDPPALNQPEIAHIVGRDPERTPMQWDASPNAGFCGETVQPWLPVADHFLSCNVAGQEQDPGSMLHLFRALTQLRQREPTLTLGDYQGVRTFADDVILAYQRRLEGHGTFLIVLNLSSQEHVLDFRSIAEDGEIVLNTTLTRRGPVKLGELKVLPDEGLILKVP